MMDRFGEMLSIGELSARTNVSVRALRHYEQNGLLPADRNSSGHRRFDPRTTETVRRIRLFLDAGLPLAVIARVLPCFTGQGERLDPCITRHLDEHAATLQGRIHALTQQANAAERLQHLLAS